MRKKIHFKITALALLTIICNLYIPTGISGENHGVQSTNNHYITKDQAMGDTRVIAIAILKAKPGHREELKQMLLNLIEPTRAEAGNLDYVLFELSKEPGTFYMREAFSSRSAFEAHLETPHFKKFAGVMSNVLSEPIDLHLLDQISP